MSVAHWRLPAPISREVVLTTGGDLELVGGLTSNGSSSAAVLLLNPTTGTTRPWGRLANPSHDAAGAILNGRGYLFGGGDTTSSATVQRLHSSGLAEHAGTLPSPRSDLAAVTVGTTVYLLGGYNGTRLAPAALESRDGTRFTNLASLPVPVRYPTVVAQRGTIWIFGGQSAAGLSDIIQRLDLPTGRATVDGHPPTRLSAAAAVVLNGHIYLCGGTTPNGPTDAIRRFDPNTARNSLIGHLPAPLTNSASAAIANTGYLLGGGTPASTATVVLLHETPARSATTDGP